MIRPAVPDDLPAIRAVVDRAFAPYAARIGRPPAPMLADHAADVAAGRVHVETDAAGRPRGVAVFRPDGHAMLLETVAVDPDHAGRGIGRALIAACEAEARRLGLGAVRLYTNAAMDGARALYPRLGYREAGRGAEDGYDRVRFVKALAAARCASGPNR